MIRNFDMYRQCMTMLSRFTQSWSISMRNEAYHLTAEIWEHMTEQGKAGFESIVDSPRNFNRPIPHDENFHVRIMLISVDAAMAAESLYFREALKGISDGKGTQENVKRQDNETGIIDDDRR